MNSEKTTPTAPCACDCYPSSLRLSMTRIKTWGPDSPMLHNDALKVVEYLEHLAAVESGDMASDPEYQAFVDGQLKYCRCASRYAPCDGVLAGGMCDDMQDDDEERCFFVQTWIATTSVWSLSLTDNVLDIPDTSGIT